MAATRKDIITLPHKDLRTRSKRVGLVTPEIINLIEDMQASTLDWEDSREHEVGVALAAIQLDQPFRIVVIRNNFDDKTDRNFRVFINPEVVKYEGDIEEDFEGCLSVKNVYGKVPRYTKVRVRAMNMQGRQVRLSATGFLARVFQHEIDHTNGKMFVDHIEGLTDAFYKLTEDGKLEALDYEKDVKNSGIFR